jgi:hypothetical protein
MVSIRSDYLALAALVVLLAFGLIAGFTSEKITGAVVHDTCHEGKVGGWNYCSEDCPCGLTEGDCDSNNDCELGLKCVDNFGAKVGLSSWTDVCVDYPTYLEYKKANERESVTYVVG